MDGFTLPKEFDDFITSASDLLSQYKQHSNNQFQDFLVFRIFLDGSTDTTLDTMTTLRQEVMTIILPLMKHYMWHKDSLRVKVIVPEDKSPIYLGGVLEFGDCVDDEWFVVSLLYEVSKQIPRISISVTDTDGQFLLIEASSADIPDWIGPENSENRVWIKGGQLHIIPLDEAGRKRSGGITVSAALSVLATSNSQDKNSTNSTLATRAVQKTLLSRIQPARAKNEAQLHHTAITVPKKVALLLTARPSLIAHAVSGLCSTHERTKHTNKVISSMSYFGTSPLVTVSVTLTRALYAQLMFQERFHPPPKFLNAQRVLQTHQQRIAVEEGQCNDRAWDTAAAKAFDVGCRVACGLEISYQRALGEEKQWHLCRQQRDETVRSHFADTRVSASASAEIESATTPSHVVITVPTADFSSETILSMDMEDDHTPPSASNKGIEVMNAFRSVLSFSEVVNVILQEPPQPLSPRAKSTNSTSKMSNYPRSLIEEEEESAGDQQVRHHHSGTIQDIVLSEISPNVSDSDGWLYMTPEEFDANMESRINNPKTFASSTDTHPATTPVTTSPPSIHTDATSRTGISIDVDMKGGEDSDDDANTPDIWKNHVSSPSKTVDKDNETEKVNQLSNIVSGMDSFMASYSDYSGVSKGAQEEEVGDDEDDVEDDDDDDDDNSERNENFEDEDSEDNDTDITVNTHPPIEAKKLEMGIEKAIEFDSSKLMEILAAQGLTSAESTLALALDQDLDQSPDISHRGKDLVANVDDDDDDVEEVALNKLSLSDGGDGESGSGQIKSDMKNLDVLLDDDDQQSDTGSNDRDSFYDDSEEDSDDYGSDDEEKEEEEEGEGEEESESGPSLQGGDDANKKEYMEAYLDALDIELSSSTLVETFEKFETEDTEGVTEEQPSASLRDVDIEKNLLKNFLESHAGQLGATGPASNLLSQMGLSLPRPPKMNEEHSLPSSSNTTYGLYDMEEDHKDSDDEEESEVSHKDTTDDQCHLTHEDKSNNYMNPAMTFNSQDTTLKEDKSSNYFLNDSSLD